jgi:LysR family transcriptional regulator, nod-box dependent transcriptional activator
VRFNKLDLNLLVALDAMLTERSISKAAQQVHLSQSAMSASLARLREYFNDPLLVQVGRQLELTPRAVVLKDAVHDLLLRANTVLTAEPAFYPETADREFSLLLSDYNNMLLLPVVLRLAQAEAPQVRFDFVPQERRQFPHLLLERGEADMLLIPDRFASAEHPSEPVLEDDFVCIAAAENTAIGDTLSLAQYLEMGHIVVNPGLDTLFLRDAGITRKEEVKTFNFTSLPTLVMGTRRIATVQGRIARLAIDSYGMPLRILPVPIELPKLRIVMQWHRYHDLDPGLIWLRDLVRRAAIQVGPPAAIA